MPRVFSTHRVLESRQAASLRAHHLSARSRAKACLLVSVAFTLVSELLEISFNLTSVIFQNPFKVPTYKHQSLDFTSPQNIFQIINLTTIAPLHVFVLSFTSDD